jgi:hypothetical protein
MKEHPATPLLKMKPDPMAGSGSRRGVNRAFGLSPENDPKFMALLLRID